MQSFRSLLSEVEAAWLPRGPDTKDIRRRIRAALSVSEHKMILKGLDTPVDCSKIAPAIKAAGYAYVGRYYSFNARKNLSPQEAAALSGADLDILSIWEARGDRYETFTATNGAREAHAALDLATRVGQPEGSAIYFAVDFDASAAQVAGGVTGYFRAVCAIVRPKYKIGVYGSGAVCDALSKAGLADFQMLACAGGWRGTRGYDGADIEQGLPTTKCGIPVDPDTIVRQHAVSGRDIGAWRLPMAAPAVVHPTLRLGAKDDAVEELQRRLVGLGYDAGPDDKDFGPRTDGAVRDFQKDNGLLVDGICGPHTWDALAHAEAIA